MTLGEAAAFALLTSRARAEREGEKPCCCITASTRSRVRSLTPLSLLSTRDTVDFPTPLKRAISLMVSRFCMQGSRDGPIKLSLMLLNQTAMSKVWFTSGLVTRVYHSHNCHK